MSIIQEYGRLARLHSSALTGLTPVLGAIAVGVHDICILFILFLIGLCTHIFGFVFNEYMDIDIDSKSKILKDKPLVKGTISKNAAISFAFSAIIFGYLLILILALYCAPVKLLGIVFYTFAWLSIGAYDLTSKLVRGSDLALALWTGSLCLFGGFAVEENPNYLLLVIAGLAFFQLMVQNILAGLKDVSHDKLGLGTTTPIRMGVRLIGYRLFVPYKFQAYIYGLKVVHLILIFTPFIFIWLYANLVQLFFIVILILINFGLVFRIFNSRSFNRKNLLRFIGLHEIISYSIVPIMLFGIIDLLSVIFLIVLPILWLAIFLKLLYGQLVPKI